MIQKTLHKALFSIALLPGLAFAQTSEERISQLEEQVNALATMVDQQSKPQSTPQKTSKTTIGGYGEIKYHHETTTALNGQKTREIDISRFVLFVGHEFSDKIHLVSELEVEHAIAASNQRGAVELEQLYIDFELSPGSHLKAGMVLMPIGIVNETHEPPTFYGVDRPVIEKTIIPTTWWSTGVMWSKQFKNGLQTDIMIHEGLKTDDPNATTGADPYDIKGGKQKSSFATAYDLATTVRVKYTGTAGLELAAYGQFQPDLDQSAGKSYADDALLLGGHAIYQLGNTKLTGLYAQWMLGGDGAKTAGKDSQYGGYVEASYKINSNWGVFGRSSQWSQKKDETKNQQNVGFSYWPHEDIVVKADIQQQNKEAGDLNGFNLGLGFQF